MHMIAEIERPRDACLEEVEWFLCGAITEGDRTRETVISKPRFRVGRRSACDLRVAWSTVSGVHAEFVKTASTLFLRDLGSTNGTFVNGRQIVADTNGTAGNFAEISAAATLAG
jgi:pSer/pThr/pTyr-binding forkhead associated (FHA) protein